MMVTENWYNPYLRHRYMALLSSVVLLKCKIHNVLPACLISLQQKSFTLYIVPQDMQMRNSKQLVYFLLFFLSLFIFLVIYLRGSHLATPYFLLFNLTYRGKAGIQHTLTGFPWSFSNWLSSSSWRVKYQPPSALQGCQCSIANGRMTHKKWSQILLLVYSNFEVGLLFFFFFLKLTFHCRRVIMHVDWFSLSFLTRDTWPCLAYSCLNLK